MIDATHVARIARWLSRWTAPAARARLSEPRHPDDRAVHARLAERRHRAAAGAASFRPHGAERDRRQPARRRHHDRDEGRGPRGARRLHAAVPELELRRRAGDVQEPRLRSVQGVRAGRQRRRGALGHGGAAGSAGALDRASSSPMPRPIPASSISASGKAPRRNWSANGSRRPTGSTSAACRTAAARRRSPTCWAAASISTSAPSRRWCR